MNIAIREPVAYSARSNVNKWLATGSNKVEVYYNDYRIKLGKSNGGNSKIKTYYIGSPTQDSLGTTLDGRRKRPVYCMYARFRDLFRLIIHLSSRNGSRTILYD